MPTPEHKEDAPSVGARVSSGTKKRVQEIAHERTTPGEHRVRESDVLRDALQLYIDFYDRDHGPTAAPEKAAVGREIGDE